MSFLSCVFCIEVYKLGNKIYANPQQNQACISCLGSRLYLLVALVKEKQKNQHKEHSFEFIFSKKKRMVIWPLAIRSTLKWSEDRRYGN